MNGKRDPTDDFKLADCERSTAQRLEAGFESTDVILRNGCRTGSRALKKLRLEDLQ